MQAMLVLSSIQPDAARWKKGRLKPDRVFRQSLAHEENLQHAAKLTWTQHVALLPLKNELGEDFQVVSSRVVS